MKTIFMFIILTFGLVMPSHAGKVTINSRFIKQRSGQSIEVDRVPTVLPIVITYDAETQILEIESEDETIEGVVFLYKLNGDLINYSPTINSSFHITEAGAYIVSVQGDGWISESNIII